MKNNEYDAIIIGAGIGGLVCGCYLAKAGMKVLIVEKNAKPGGYCTSFTSNGFKFDAFVHSLGSLKKGEIIANVLDDLNISKRIKFKRYNPSDLVITPDYKVYFWNEIEKTVKGLQKIFPDESLNIEIFFKFINDTTGNHTELRKQNFEELLSKYFRNDKLKAIFALFTLGNVGLPPSLLSAFTAVKFYKQFMLDGGYYPHDGMQSFSDLLANRFKEFGGTLKVSSMVTKMEMKNSKVRGIILKDGNKFLGKYIIAACDARQTFFNFIGKEHLEKEFIKTLEILKPSLSMFIMYFGLKKHLKELPKEGINAWFMPNYNLENMFKMSTNGRKENPSWYMLRLLSDQKSLLMFMDVSFRSVDYWRKNKEAWSKFCINLIAKDVPDFEKNIVYKNISTPNTLFNMTLNHNGASYGWAAMFSQLAIPGLSQTTPIDNLFLTGHWTTLAQGIPGVSYVGKNTASIILRKEKIISK